MGNTHPSKDSLNGDGGGVPRRSCRKKSDSHGSKTSMYAKSSGIVSDSQSEEIPWSKTASSPSSYTPPCGSDGKQDEIRKKALKGGTVGHITDRLDQINFTTSKSDLLRIVSDNKGQIHTSRRRRQSMHVPDDEPAEAAPAGGMKKTPPHLAKHLHLRVNSCGTLFVDATVVHQNLDLTAGRFSAVVWELISHGHAATEPLLEEIFDETVHPIMRPSSQVETRNIPTERVISKFLKLLFRSAQLCAEVAIIALIYVHRLVGMAGISLHASNWRRVVLGSVALASKVWDDQAVWNIDYCTILPMISIDDMNELERKFLLFIQFNVSVEPSLYAKYYFDLRKLAIAEDFSRQPLDNLTAKEFSITCSTKRSDDQFKPSLRDKSRSKSAEWLSLKPKKAFL